MAVLRQMLLVAYRLLRTEETYEYGHRRAMKMGRRCGIAKEEIG
jgi:hypothetical protein